MSDLTQKLTKTKEKYEKLLNLKEEIPLLEKQLEVRRELLSIKRKCKELNEETKKHQKLKQELEELDKELCDLSGSDNEEVIIDEADREIDTYYYEESKTSSDNDETDTEKTQPDENSERDEIFQYNVSIIKYILGCEFIYTSTKYNEPKFQLKGRLVGIDSNNIEKKMVLYFQYPIDTQSETPIIWTSFAAAANQAHKDYNYLFNKEKKTRPQLRDWTFRHPLDDKMYSILRILPTIVRESKEKMESNPIKLPLPSRNFDGANYDFSNITRSLNGFDHLIGHIAYTKK
jgi:hypothetical protein